MSKTSEFSKTVQILREQLHEKRITCFFAPSEADPQCAFLEKMKIAHVVMTEDSDLIHLGCKRVLFKTNGRGWGDFYNKEDAKELFRKKSNKSKRLQLLCSVLGNDYNKRIRGLGPKASLKFINGLVKPNKLTTDEFKKSLKKYLVKTRTVTRQNGGVSYSVKQITVQKSAKKFMKNFKKADFATKHPVVLDIKKMVHTRLNEYHGQVPEELKDIAGKIEDVKRIVVQTALGNYGPEGPNSKPEFKLRPRDCVPPYPDTCPWSKNFQPPQGDFILHELSPEVPKDEKPSKTNPICSLCNKGFASWTFVKYHQAIHTGEKLWKCKDCGSAFLTQHRLRMHVKIGHGQNHQCYRCYAKFQDIASLIGHEELDNCTPAILKCDYCDEKFPDYFKRHIHHQVVHPRVVFSCIVCDKPFLTQTELDEHLQIHAGNKAHGCFECGERFEQGEELKNHFSSCHPSDKKYECLALGCGMKFEKKSALATHAKKHEKHQFWEFRCVYCKAAEFNKRGLFLQHILEHSKCEICEHQFDYPYQVDIHHKFHSKCQYCSAQFSNELELTIHNKSTHDSDSLFRCQKCGVVYTKQIHLDLHHELTRHNATKLTCLECGKDYMQRKSLKIHMIIHKGTYRCKICGKSFQSPSELKIHVKNRHASGSFKCDRCSKTFNTKHKLDGHLKRTHDAVKKVQCTLCDKAFISLGYLNTHMKNVHPDKLLACPLCQSTRKNVSALNQHMKEAHSPNSTPKAVKPVKEFQCELCTSSFTIKGELSKHVKRVHGPKSLDRFECVFCNYQTRRKGNIASHVRRCHPEKIENNLLPQPYARKIWTATDVAKEANKTSNLKFECRFCIKKFVTPGGVQYHAKNKHPEEYKKNSSINFLAKKIKKGQVKENNVPMLKCVSCNKTFKLNIEMKKHKCAIQKGEAAVLKNSLRDEGKTHEIITLD